MFSFENLFILVFILIIALLFFLSEKSRLEKEVLKLKQEALEQEKLKQESLRQEKSRLKVLKQEKLIQQRLEQERLNQGIFKYQERLKQQTLEPKRLKQEALEQERLRQEALEQERLRQEALKQERLRQEALKQKRLENFQLIKPFYPKINGCIENIEFKALIEYYPKKYCFPEITSTDIDNRKSVWNFKDGYNTNGYALLFSRVLKAMYSFEELKSIVLLQIPASTENKTETRYKNLFAEISNITGIINGYFYMKNTEDCAAKHLNGGSSSLISTLKINNSALSGKHIILLDDVITKGNNLKELSYRLKKECKVSKVEGIFLGKTTHL